MAVVTVKSPVEIANDAREALQKEALQRLSDARREKASITNDHQNCYYYTAPRRIRAQQSAGQQAGTKPGDDRQLQTSFGFVVVEDFMSMLIETFMPREGWWAERQMPTNPDEDGDEDSVVEELNGKLKAEDKKIFDLIRSSNFYAEVAKAGVPDAAIGVNALLIRDPGRGQPVICLGVPIRELDMDLGPDGRPDFRSVTRTTKYRHLAAELGEMCFAKLDDEARRKVREEGDQPVEVVWTWWRDWSNFNDTEFRHVVLIANKLLHDESMKGEGCLPLVLGRFGATPDFAWPDGPMVKALADMVQLDEVRGALIENVDFTLRPPKSYEDDGVINIPEGGMRPGDLLPKRPSGGQNAFEDIYTPRPIEAALFETDHLQTQIKRLHFVDYPEQRGKTPPTATQWIDELVIRQKRIGTPGYAYWHEFPYAVFQRFRYLGENLGKVQTATAIGVPAGASVKPYNPAERAQDSQDVQTAVQFAQIGQAVAPTMWQVVVDEVKTVKKLKAKLRDEIIVIRDEADIEQRIKVLSALGAQMTGGGDQGGAPPAQGAA